LTSPIKDLSGNKLAWVGSIFYIGYLAFEYPTTILIQTLPVGQYIGTIILLWGFVVGVTSACNSFAQLMIVRAFTGVIEAAISPSFLYIIATWYTREEIPVRMGVWYAGNSFGGGLAHLFSWGIGHLEKLMAPWRWLYLVSYFQPMHNRYTRTS
jgi:MFS family permease